MAAIRVESALPAAVKGAPLWSCLYRPLGSRAWKA
jgi:hypothetical protein